MKSLIISLMLSALTVFPLTLEAISSSLFKPGTIVKDNSGRITAGTLRCNCNLTPPAWKGVIPFKAGTVATFDINGRVTQGTIANNWNLMTPACKGVIPFKAGTVVKFDIHGRVTQGTIATNCNLTPPGWNGAIGFKAGTVVKFDISGRVTSGTLSSACTFLDTKGRRVTKPAGSFVKFAKNGRLIP